MSGGSQHNPNGRQSQMGPSWSPLQLQMANLLARAPQAHMASERGVTWHTPTPPPHLYHVPAPSPPDPLQGLLQLQAMKNAGNSVFRHTATPPELYRHTPTPPDKHHMRHTPSPGDVKGGSTLPPAELYAHLGPGRDKLRPEELLSYARVGVDLSVGSRSASNGSANSLSIRDAPTINNSSLNSPSLSVRDASSINNSSLLNPLTVRDTTMNSSPITVRDTTSINSAPSLTVRDTTSINSAVRDSINSASLTVRDTSSINSAPSLSVRDAPTINSLIARAAPRPPHARVDALLERLVPSPVSPHSVIVHSRAQPTPSPPSSNEDSADSCGAAPGSKRKRKPERTIRVPSVPPSAPPSVPPCAPPSAPTPPPPAARVSPQEVQKPLENGDIHAQRNGPEDHPPTPPQKEHQQKPERPLPPAETPPPTRRKSRSGSAETIADIAAMIASTTSAAARQTPTKTDDFARDANPVTNPATIDTLKSVLASPEAKKQESETEVKKSPPKSDENPSEAPPVETAAAPRRRSARTSNTEATNVPIESPSEAKPAEPETSGTKSAEPTAASFVEVEKQLENMFAGLEESNNESEKQTKARKRRKSAPTKGERKERKARRSSRASEGDDTPRKKMARKRSDVSRGKKKDVSVRDAYDSGSNASSSRSRGPYIQIRGPRDSPLSVSVMNACAEEDADRRQEYRVRTRGLHVSTLGLRYDAAAADRSWLCAFCGRGPHSDALGDLFGPYALDDDTEQEMESQPAWLHAACGVWTPGVLAAGARVRGLGHAVRVARAVRCLLCCKPGATLACSARGCRARGHVPCARAARWDLQEETFRVRCPAHTT
ncbi:uncharacterized protein CG5098-like isoform X2 [Plodia interpunctella]|uniref:uncharacterized protein CG5098-like isoform X2 n=1 Tax=Plodia interpunctella TaxID=58824 RepID=UPI002367AB61|nr:uncharacterized protein CG5098-like isoform X2 [Plodia interpunctella]